MNRADFPEKHFRFPERGAWAAALVLGLLALYVGLRYYSASPLNVWENRAVYRTGYTPLASGDSAVFLSIGQEILRGGMPYRGLFDHKGPLIYLANALGQAAGGIVGVWLLELLALAGSLLFFYRTARLFAGRASAVLASAAVLFGCVPLLKGGNFAETYALPFQAATLYWFCKYLKQERFLSAAETARCGAEFGAVFLLRPNITGIWILFCAAVLADSAIRKRWRFLVSRAGAFLFGTAAVAAPVLLWLAAGGAFPDFIRQFWLYNLEYTGLASPERVLFAFRYFLGLSDYTFAALGVFLFLVIRPAPPFRRSWSGLFLLNLALGFLLAALPGRCDTHYLISAAVGWFPALVWLAARLEQGVKEGRRKKRALVCAAVCAVLIFRPIRGALGDFSLAGWRAYQDRLNPAACSPLVDPPLDETVRWIRNHTRPADTLAGYGENSIARILLYSGRRSAVKYIYCPSLTPPIAGNPLFRDLLGRLQESRPAYLIRQKQILSDFDRTFATRDPFPEPLRQWLGEAGYRKVFENESFEIYALPGPAE